MLQHSLSFRSAYCHTIQQAGSLGRSIIYWQFSVYLIYMYLFNFDIELAKSWGMRAIQTIKASIWEQRSRCTQSILDFTVITVNTVDPKKGHCFILCTYFKALLSHNYLLSLVLYFHEEPDPGQGRHRPQAQPQLTVSRTDFQVVLALVAVLHPSGRGLALVVVLHPAGRVALARFAY